MAMMSHMKHALHHGAGYIVIVPVSMGDAKAKCISTGDKAKAIGWVFVKRVKYTDCNEWFTQEAWVTVHTGAPIRTIDYQYA